MFHIVLYEPEIPPNTGNLIRLAANLNAELHLIEPLGFSLDIKAVRRAGLDYHDLTRVHTHNDIDKCFAQLLSQTTQVFACTTKGDRNHDAVSYRADDVLLFGPETRGLPSSVLQDKRVSASVRIPMVAGNRSLNLSNAASIVAYEAWRQNNFLGADTP